MSINAPSHASEENFNLETSDLTSNKSRLTALKREIAVNLGGEKERYLTARNQQEIAENIVTPLFALNGHEIIDTRETVDPAIAFNPATDMEVHGHEIIDLRPNLAQAA